MDMLAAVTNLTTAILELNKTLQAGALKSSSEKPIKFKQDVVPLDKISDPAVLASPPAQKNAKAIEISETPVAPEPANVEPVVEEDSVEEPEVVSKPVTKADLPKAALAVAEAFGKQAIVDILAKCNAMKVSDLTEDRYQEFKSLCEAALANETANV